MTLTNYHSLRTYFRELYHGSEKETKKSRKIFRMLGKCEGVRTFIPHESKRSRLNRIQQHENNNDCLTPERE